MHHRRLLHLSLVEVTLRLELVDWHVSEQLSLRVDILRVDRSSWHPLLVVRAREEDWVFEAEGALL